MQLTVALIKICRSDPMYVVEEITQMSQLATHVGHAHTCACLGHAM